MLSIRLTDANQFLQLNPNVDIQVTLSNPLFSEGITDGSYCFNFQIPNVPKNALLFGFPDRLTKLNHVYNLKLKCSLYWKFKFWKNGVISTFKANHNFIEISIGVDESNVIADKGNILLPDLFGTEKRIFTDIHPLTPNQPIDLLRYYVTQAMNSDAQKNYPDSDFCWPSFHNQAAMNNIRESNDNLKGKYQAYWPIINYFRNNTYDTSLTLGFHNIVQNVFSPQMYNSFLLDRIAENFRLNINIFRDDPELNQLFLFNPYIMGYMHPSKTYPDDYTVMNCNNFFFLKDIVPKITVSEYLNSLFKMFNARIYFHQDNSFSIVHADSILNSDEVILLKNNAIGNIEYVDIVNSISKFHYSLKKINDGWQSQYTNDFSDMNIVGAVNDVWNLPAGYNNYNDVCYVINKRKWYNWSFNKDSNSNAWIFFSDELIYDFFDEDIFSNPDRDADFKWETNAGTIIGPEFIWEDQNNVGGTQRGIKIPHVYRGAYVHGMNETQEDRFNELAFLFYRGICESSDVGDPFPYASYDNINKYNPSNSFDYSLRWHGESGLFNKFHKSFFEFLKNSLLFKFSLYLDNYSLLNIDLSKKYQCGNFLFFFKSIEFTFSGSSIKNIKAEAYKI